MRRVIVFVAALSVVLAPTAAPADMAHRSERAVLASGLSAPTPDIPTQAQRRITSMTYNLYLGTDLTPLFGKTGYELLLAAAAAYAHVQQTDFEERAEAIADLIVESHPHVVGLQEVALWQTAPVSDPTQLTTTYDFLQMLLDALEERGAPYRSVAVGTYFSGALPIDMTTLVRFTDRNAIIVRDDLPDGLLQTAMPASSTFQAGVPLAIGGQPVTITRGWSTVDVKFRGKWFRFANTHLEAYSVQVRQLQTQELVAALAASPWSVIVAGDLNSYVTWPGDSHAILTAAGFTDVWIETMPGIPGYTASFGDDLEGPPTELDHTVDYVMRSTNGTLVGVGAGSEIVGEEADDRTDSGMWPSDHAGIGVTIRIVKEA